MSDDRTKKAGETAMALFGRRMDTGVGNEDGVLTDAFAHVYGEIWSRPGLDLKSRSLATVAALVALDKPAELRIHLVGALNTGWTRAELREVFLQLGYYAGFPAALEAMKVLDEAFISASASRS
jgi:alkylhydroperoxidase/carboxymuconolactone decarboxylase family protein YurZ